MNKLAILSSHPIQYNAPLFKLLAQDGRFKVKVYYTLGKESSGFTDPGFKKTIKWDIPLLDGYEYTFIKNTSPNPSTSLFKGIINPTLVQEIESFGATHILVYGWSFDSHLKVLRHFRNKAKILFRGDSTLLDEKLGLKTVLRRILLLWVYKHINAALYVGTNNKKYFLKHGVPENKLIYAPHAIDNDRFSSLEHEHKASELKQSLGIEPEKNVFLFTGKLEWKKNPKLLINAFNSIKSPSSILLVIGDGALEIELKQLADSCQNIKFLPFQNQSIMPVIYRLGDVLILPSVTETWGLSMNEAMACGLAVIASNKVGGATDLIEIGKNGYLFESENVVQLADILRTIANKPKQEIKEMGNYSAVKIKSWSYQHTSDAISNYINS
ncbi:glycosyltransferase family 4 protein [Pontibacter sp. BT310]|uniref:Glycosyltransferase family 4 protein n=1 Tax=Pontibacter populi TaxID=890055 RepID=A0ABS6XFA0_9BACT|nr:MULTISPECIES: glycosyltransferase family 4 protein [Pontibacter]MBJ6119804.1 glycosyltransferase family 4 protein [Pontibacter sp. BT310]MBR0572233.1 glycosyltransferase family 4 protein [Microvirga sp. STS03]MBW3366657.1 glycosyltransferase family 4 protein [Pontibacter populi]